MLGMYKNMHSEAARVFKARIGAMLPGNESLQRAIYRDIFDKMFTMNMLEAYLPLQRIGDFWLSYTATDPTSKELEVFSETFETPEQRARTVKELTELQTADPTTGIASIATFSNYKDFQERGAPTAFVAKTVLKIDQSVKERAEKAGADAKQEALAAGIIEADADVLAENAQSAYTTEATADATKLKEDLVNIALEMMPERSFLQSYKARKGTSGFEGGRTPLNKKLERHDAINLMMRKSTMMSRQLADLEFGAKASDLIRRLNEVAHKKSPNYSDKDNANMRISLNVLKKGLGNINVKRSKLVQSLNTFTYMMTLGFNVSSAVMNVMGIPTIIAPYLAGKYGANSTARALSRATKVIANSGRTRMVSRVDEFGNIEQYERGVSKADASLENYNFDAYDYTAGYNSGSNKTARYGPLTSVMRDRGLFADSLHYDNLDVQGMKTGGLAQSFVMKGAYLMHQTEKLVRESTAIATYDLELNKISKGNDAHVFTKEQLEAAALNAAYETEVTNGTIAAAAAPNFAQNGIMPMMYMFKRYPLAIYNLLGTLANESFPGHKKLLAEFGSIESEGYIEGMQGRKVARLQLAAIVGNVGMWAGVAGLPLYGALTGVLDYVFKDEDELDSDTLFRIAIGEGASRGLANYLFGVEASSRIGLANMFYRDPFRSEDNPPVWNFIEGAGGPVVGLTNAILTRVPDLFEKGQTGRALEALAPASMRNVMKSFRFSSAGGAESMRGDMIAEIGMGQVLGQLLGFSPAGYIRQTQLSSALKSMDIAIAEQRTQALKRLNLANREGNIIAAKRAMETIDEFNKKNPDNPIKRSTIKSSAANFKKTTLRTYNGVQYNPATEKRMVQWIAYFEGRGDAPT